MTAQLLPNVIQYFYDSNGAPLAGGKLYSYAAGTTTPLATYTDETAVTPNTNPIILNAAGQANVWIGSLAYKFKLTDSLNNVQWTVDNVSYINPDSIDLTKINGDIAGLALLQNGGGSLDVQVDNATIQITSNQLALKSVPAALIPASSKMEVLFKSVRDLRNPGSIQQIPQYEWSSPTFMSNPSTLPGNAASCTAWSPNGEFLAVGFTGTPFLLIYQLCGGVLTALQNPTTLPAGNVNALSWSPCGDYLAVAHHTTPCITIYLRDGNVFTKLPDPASVPTAATIQGSYVNFSPNSDFLILGWQKFSPAGEGFILYERTINRTITVTGTSAGSISGTNDPITNNVTGSYSGPITAAASSTPTTFVDISTASTLSGIIGPFAWSADSSLLAASDISTGIIDVFFRRDFILTGITPPSLGSFATQQIDYAFSPDGNFLAIAIDVTPFILLFQIQSYTFTQLSNPTTLPPGATSCVNWSANSEYLFVGDASGTSPFMTIYQVTNPILSPTFTKIANPGVVPAGAVNRADWSQTKEFLAIATGSSPFIQVYETASTLPSNALLYTREAPNV